MQNKEPLIVSLLQTTIIWEDIPSNLAHYQTQCVDLEATDLLILPEMFQTGFSMEPKSVAEKMEGKSMQWMHTMAEKKDCVVTGSLIIEENGHYYNRLIWMSPDGKYQSYDKRHLFSMAGEDKSYTAGEERLIVSLKGWNICPLICYDLRFPVWSRNQQLAYDVLIYTANWPAVRSNVWQVLMQARAIENQAYVLGVNRVGKDGKDIAYSGNSSIIDFKGEMIQTKVDEAGILQEVLSKEALVNFRTQFPAWQDAD